MGRAERVEQSAQARRAPRPVAGDGTAQAVVSERIRLVTGETPIRHEGDERRTVVGAVRWHRRATAACRSISSLDANR